MNLVRLWHRAHGSAGPTLRPVADTRAFETLARLLLVRPRVRLRKVLIELAPLCTVLAALLACIEAPNFDDLSIDFEWPDEAGTRRPDAPTCDCSPEQCCVHRAVGTANPLAICVEPTPAPPGDWICSSLVIDDSNGLCACEKPKPRCPDDWPLATAFGPTCEATAWVRCVLQCANEAPICLCTVGDLASDLGVPMVGMEVQSCPPSCSTLPCDGYEDPCAAQDAGDTSDR